MKIYLVLLCLTVTITGLSGQSMPYSETDKSLIEAVMSDIDRSRFLEAAEQLNVLAQKYPGDAFIRMMKGAARMGLNDVEGARKDLFASQQLGILNSEYVNAFTSKEFMVTRILKDLDYDYKLDPSRDFKPVVEEKDRLQGALRPERTCFDVYFYDLAIKVRPEEKTIEGSNRILFKVLEKTKTIQIDLFPEFEIKTIKRNGKELAYSRNFGAVFVDLGSELVPGMTEEISVEYSGMPREAPRPPWNGGFVWEKNKGRHHIGVACEHLGASSWWPCKDHLSDKPDSMRITVKAPSGYQAVSNGNLVSRSEEGNGFDSFVWFVSYPINNYNVTLYIGDFVNFSETIPDNTSPYRIDYYVLPENLKKAKEYYAQTSEIIKIFQELYGLYPFPRDGAAMVEAPFEGMEHQGAIAIGGNYGKSSNKRQYWTKEYDYLLVHETGHEWWGNAVAIGDMADAWINEGFTTFSEYLFAEKRYGYPSYVRAAALNQKQILNLWPLVGQRDINENTFLGGDIYNKGAAMLNNLRCILDNDTLFFSILRDYYDKFKYRISTTDDFVRLVNAKTGRDLTDFFNKFLYSSDPPVLLCNYSIRNRKLTFSYRWLNAGSNFQMPFCIALNDKEYVRLNGTTQLQLFERENVKTFFVPNENRFDEELVPRNSLTYYWTSWPL